MEKATDLLTAKELAKRLRVSPETVRAWARQGRIPTLRLSRKALRYNLEAVIAALSATPTKGVPRAK